MCAARCLPLRVERREFAVAQSALACGICQFQLLRPSSRARARKSPRARPPNAMARQLKRRLCSGLSASGESLLDSCGAVLVPLCNWRLPIADCRLKERGSRKFCLREAPVGDCRAPNADVALSSNRQWQSAIGNCSADTQCESLSPDERRWAALLRVDFHSRKL